MRANKSLNERLSRFKPITSVVEGPIKRLRFKKMLIKRLKISTKSEFKDY
jgi:hypothetical protein